MSAHNRMEALDAAFYEGPGVSSWYRALNALAALEGDIEALDCALDHLARWSRATLKGGTAMGAPPFGVWQMVEMSLDESDYPGVAFCEEELMGWHGARHCHWPQTGQLHPFCLSITPRGRIQESALQPARVLSQARRAFDDETLDFISDPRTAIAFEGSLYRGRANPLRPSLDEGLYFQSRQEIQIAPEGQVRIHAGARGNLRVLDVLIWSRHALWRMHATDERGARLRVIRQRFAPLFAFPQTHRPSRIAGQRLDAR